MVGIPPAHASDSEDVVWALQTADALWKRGERNDAVVWLRRAAQAAGEANDDDRSLFLARHAAELTDWVSGGGDMAGSGDSVDVLMDASEEGLPSFPLEGDDDDRALVDDSEIEDVAEDVQLVSLPPMSVSPEELEDEDDRVHAMVTHAPPQPGRSPGAPPPLPARATASQVDPSELAARPESMQSTRKLPAQSYKDPELATGENVPRALRVQKSEGRADPSATTRESPASSLGGRGQTVPKPVARRSEPPKRAGAKSTYPKPVAPREGAKAKRSSTVPGRGRRSIAPSKNERPQFSTDETPSLPPDGDLSPLVAAVEPESIDAPTGAPPALVEPEDAATLPPLRSPPAESSDPVLTVTTAQHAIADIPDSGPELTDDTGLETPDELSEPGEPSVESAEEPAEEAPPPDPAPSGRALLLDEPESEAVPEVLDEAALEAPLDLAMFEAFADLPDEARDEFALAAQDEVYAQGEEVSGFALALVVQGGADVAATIVDAPAARLETGSILRARGTIEAHVPMRLVASTSRARIATWPKEAVEAAFAACSWVEDDLRAASDRVQTLVGATMGPFGERLDAMLRAIVTDKLVVKSLSPGEILVAQGKPVPGFVVVGVGILELVTDDGKKAEVGAGEFLFGDAILSAAPAPATARAGGQGALILFGNRMVAQELLVTCPPLLEIFAGM